MNKKLKHSYSLFIFGLFILTFSFISFLFISLLTSSAFANSVADSTSLIMPSIENINLTYSSFQLLNSHYFSSLPLKNSMLKELIFASSQNKVIITTTEGKILKLNVIAVDLDKEDKIKFLYLPPFNSSGLFLAKPGIYNTFVIATDGKNYTYLPIKIIVNPKQELPTIVAPEIQYFKEGENATLEYYVYPKDARVELYGFFKKKNKYINYNSSGSYYQTIVACLHSCVKKKIKIFVEDVNLPPKIELKKHEFFLSDFFEFHKFLKIYDPDNNFVKYKYSISLDQAFKLIREFNFNALMESMNYNEKADHQQIKQKGKFNTNLIYLPITLKVFATDGLSDVNKNYTVNLVLDEKGYNFLKSLLSVDVLTLKEFEHFNFSIIRPTHFDELKLVKALSFGANLNVSIDDSFEKQNNQHYFVTSYIPDIVAHDNVIPFIRPSKNIYLVLIFGVNNFSNYDNNVMRSVFNYFLNNYNFGFDLNTFNNESKNYFLDSSPIFVKILKLKVYDVNNLPELHAPKDERGRYIFVFREGELLRFNISDKDSDFVKVYLRFKKKPSCLIKYNQRIPYDCVNNQSAFPVKIILDDYFDKREYEGIIYIKDNLTKTKLAKQNYYVQEGKCIRIPLDNEKTFDYKSSVDLELRFNCINHQSQDINCNTKKSQRKYLKFGRHYNFTIQNVLFNINLNDSKKANMEICPNYEFIAHPNKYGAINLQLLFNFDHQFKSSQNINVFVYDVNRKPKVELKILKKYIDENNQKHLIIKKVVKDLDNDTIKSYFIIDGRKIENDVMQIIYVYKIPKIKIIVEELNEAMRIKNKYNYEFNVW